MITDGNALSPSEYSDCSWLPQGVRGKYLALIYQAALSAEAKETYFKTHIDKASVTSPNGGVHFLYLVSSNNCLLLCL